MASICMNEACKSITTLEWKKGWGLKSGGLATLCYNCGSVYDSLVFCETFHLEESGWRECRLCGKRIHCGCIASKSMHEYLDSGGVGCISCVKSLETHSFLPLQMSNEGFSSMNMINSGDLQSSYGDIRINSGGSSSFEMTNFMELGRKLDTRETELCLQPQKAIKEPSSGHSSIKHEEIMFHVGEVNTSFAQRAVTSSPFPKPDGNSNMKLAINDLGDPLTSQPSLHFSLGPMDGSKASFPVAPNGGGVGVGVGVGVEGREQHSNTKVVLPFQQAQKSKPILPKSSKTGITISPDTNKTPVSQTRVPRPPVEGRGRGQLLPRYWPRITDQELQKISGDLNSSILPLFEKVLSASDAGRIGRLVLPKACAEAYFPSISQSEGIPIRIQDVKGKEWTFQFRFWPNNNSRMYVLEGVTPCIQNMQLQAGDTVTFSRLDPGGKLVMGFRKSSSSADTMQDGQATPVAHGGAPPPGETSISSANASSSMPAPGWKSNEESSQQPGTIQEKKKSRNIGLKSKRLLMNCTEAKELKLTWEEAQELLRPSPNSTPNIVMIDDQEFEEYDEPPVFGKRTVFTARISGEQEQWTQCDSCCKWRRLPVDVLLPPKWTCSDNVWDQSRCLCSADDEINPKEMENLLKADSKKRKISERIETTNKIQIHEEQELSGLDALATAAVLGDSLVDSVTEPLLGPTTKHPRHREGCSCIVCIQPPSGKGKHKPTCICNVCMTVKRRFKTLMLRKKKREADAVQGKELLSPETEGTSGQGDESRGTPSVEEFEESDNKEGKVLDLNCHPNRDDEMPLVGPEVVEEG